MRPRLDGAPCFELVAVLASALLHFVTTLWVPLRAVDQAVLGFGWLALRRDPRAHTPACSRAWGMASRGSRPVCARGRDRVSRRGLRVRRDRSSGANTFVIDAHLVPLLAVYPLWGWVQQLLVLGIAVGNLERFGVPPRLLVLVGGVGFAAVHVPDWPLCGATLLLGLLCCALFLRWRNLWPLGVLHGWLGALFYRWVLARDPWADVLAIFG
jgi:hypothetical protein